MVRPVNRVAIIGAGVSGLAAGWELSRRGWEPVVFEKSRGLSGRAATRSHGSVRYDHGANFFRTSDPEVHELIHSLLPRHELVEIPGNVWTFGQDGIIQPGDSEQNAEPKYTYQNGISTLGKLLATTAGLDVRTAQEIGALRHARGAWLLTATDGKELGAFDQVILTAPAPQAARLLLDSGLPHRREEALLGSLGKVRYRPQFSFILGFSGPVVRPHLFHALVNTDGQHPVSWVSFEEDKPGHVPDGDSVVVVQMSPHWSAAHLERPREELLAIAHRELSTLIPDAGRPVSWWDSQRWTLSHPESAADPSGVQQGEDLGLYLAGDTLTGRARVPLALKSGLATARRLVARTSGKRVVTRRSC